MAPYPGFVGGSYTSQSQLADCERMVNWYVEQVESPGASRLVGYPTPGFQSFVGVSAGITDIGARALFSMADRMHGVVGGGVYEIFQNQTVTRRGSVAQDANPATISYNGATGNQLFIAAGSNGYIVNMTTNAITQVLTGEATMGAMLDAYFLAFNRTNGKVLISDLNNGLVFDPTQFFQRTIAPDPWQAMVVDGNRKIWMIGEQTGEIWYDAGTFPIPFVPYPGAVFNYGTPAPFSVKAVGDSMMWLTRSNLGQAQVVRTQGFNPMRVSNHALETAMAGYARNASITDAEALAYEDQGHLFYVLTFPSANATWAYDVRTGIWCERGTWNTRTNGFDSWRPRVQCSAFGRHLTGDRTTGTIAQMDSTFGSELDGTAIRRLRIPPPLRVQKRRGRLHVTRLEAEFEPGTAVLNGQGSSPIVMSRYSTTFGKTWHAERTATPGRQGEYTKKVYWVRCGSSENTWVPEITVTDPIPWRLIEGYVDGAGFIQSRAA